MKALKLHLKAPLQSWTVDSAWQRAKRTNTAPTRSGIIGLLGAAMGYERNSDKLTKLNESVDIFFEVVKQGMIMTDYQTVYGGKKVLPKADSTTQKGASPQMYKEYLEDAEFFVYITGDTKLLKKLHHAVDHPEFPMYLGRKCCIPSCRINYADRLVEIKNGEYERCI